MYRIADIQDALINLVGWRQDYDPAKQIDPFLTQSESGLYFQGEHPMITLDNIRNIMPEEFVMRYPEWTADSIFSKGAKVNTGTALAPEIWRSKMDANIGHEPAVDSVFWERYDYLSDYLEIMTRDAIATMVQKFTNDKLNRGEGRNLLERRAFFDGAGRIRDVIDNQNRIVGYELSPIRSMGVTTQINRISLQMIGASGAVRLYLFHSGSATPIWSEVFNVQGNGSVEWFTPSAPLYLPYNGRGGSWYLVYNQADLPLGMEAVNVSKDWSSEPCGSCNRGDTQYWRMLTKYMQIFPFKTPVPAGFDTTPELWDIAQNTRTCTVCYGLNVETTISCDLTDFIIRQRTAFQSVLAKQVAATAMRTMAMNPSVLVNRNVKNASRNELLYELDGNPSQGLTGIGAALDNAYKALYVDVSGIDRVCLPCNNHGVRYRNA